MNRAVQKTAGQTGTYVVTTHLTGGRKSTYHAHTRKAARHHARSMCAGSSVTSITLAGPDGTETLFDAFKP